MIEDHPLSGAPISRSALGDLNSKSSSAVVERMIGNAGEISCIDRRRFSVGFLEADRIECIASKVVARWVPCGFGFRLIDR